MKAIFSVSPSNGIGANGQLLYSDPKDLRFFQEVTANGIIIMGRKTFESIGRPLRSRINIVVTRDPETASINYWKSAVTPNDAMIMFLTEKSVKEYIIANVLGFLNTPYRKIFCIGGNEVFNIFKDDISEVYLNRFKEEPEVKADTFLNMKGFDKDRFDLSTDSSSYYALEKKLHSEELKLLDEKVTEGSFTMEVWENSKFFDAFNWFNDLTKHKMGTIVGEAGTKGMFTFNEEIMRFIDDNILLKTNMWHLMKLDENNPFTLLDPINQVLHVEDFEGFFSLVMRCSALQDRVIAICERALMCNQLHQLKDPSSFNRNRYEEVIAQSYQSFEFIQLFSDKIRTEFIGGFKLEDQIFSDLANEININQNIKNEYLSYGSK